MTALAPMAELAGLVAAMADDLDGAARFGSLPFTGDELRAHYRNLVHLLGADAALTDARRRYAQQVLCELLPLTPATTGEESTE